MKRRNKLFVFPSAVKQIRCQEGRDDGYALLILLMLATVMLIALTAALPSVLTQGKREREEELIFRGNEYARAIAMFRRQFRRFPTETKELLRTNGVRFLRREYKDPMTKSGKWRFIHADATGTPIDSRTITRPKSPRPLGGNRPSMFSDEREREKKETEPPSEADEEKSKSSFFGAPGEMKGAFIIGVASTSNKNSIRVYNNKTRYGDWEFLGIEMGAGGGAMPGGGGLPGGGQGGPGGANTGFGGRPGLPGAR